MRKFFSILLITLLVILQINSVFVQKIFAIGIPEVEVNPPIISQVAEYKITFTVNQSIDTTDYIYLVFPPGTLIPCSTCNPVIAASNFTVNGVVPNQDAIGNTVARTVQLRSPVSVSSGGTVVMVIKKGARIQNPTTPGDYQLQVATSMESSYIPSKSYHLDNSKISTPAVQLGSSVIGEQSEYVISFSTGLLGKLEQGSDSIFVQFPKEVTLPSTLSANKVLLNGESGKVKLRSSGNTIELNVLDLIKENSPVTIKFTYDFGLINPKTPGQYQLSVWTSQEQTHVSSFFNITDLPEAHTMLILTPSYPDGLNGWYITQPLVILVGVSNAPGIVQAYYSIDDPSNFIPYSVPFSIPEGVHTLYYYSSNLSFNLKEDVKKEALKISTNSPLLDINLKNGDVLKSPFFVLSGSVNSATPTTLLLNEKKIQLGADGTFSRELTFEQGNNTLQFNLKDESGHEVNLTITVFVDSVPPKVTVFSPTNWQKITTEEVNVKGQTDAGASLTINDMPVTVNADGSFDFSNKFSAKGIYVIRVVSTDQAGNQSVVSVPVEYSPVQAIQVVLSIGSTDAFVNGEKKTLDVPPFIDSLTGRTLVPIRFIAEAFGADVRWDQTLKTVLVMLGSKKIVLQVGNSIAFVNGNAVQIDQPPVIVNGRTMVPIRFISESLGASVDWNSETKTITITFKPES